MPTLYASLFLHRPDKVCDRCGGSPASFMGHCDIENGPSANDDDPGLYIDETAYLWVCDGCEQEAIERAYRQSEAWAVGSVRWRAYMAIEANHRGAIEARADDRRRARQALREREAAGWAEGSDDPDSLDYRG